MEKEINNKLSFLDILIDNTDILSTSVYHKPTYTGLLANYFSFIPESYKIGLARTLIDRTFKLNNTWNLFNTDLHNLKNSLCKNMFPPKLIDSCIKSYLDSKFNNIDRGDTNTDDTRYFKLPFIGKYSSVTKYKVSKLISQLCKPVNIKLVFTTSKIKDYFSTKDVIPNALKSMVVYKFICASCKASYVVKPTDT